MSVLADPVLPEIKATHVKTIHLCLATILASISVCNARAFESNASGFQLQPGTVFRAQNGGVPLPPGVIVGAPVLGGPQPVAYPAQVLPGQGYPGQNFPAQPYAGPGYSGAPVTPIPGAAPMYAQPIVPMAGTTVPPIPQLQSGAVPGGPIPTDPNVSSWNAFSPPIQQLNDPFLSPGAPPTNAPYTPFGMQSTLPPGGFSTFGANSPAPFRNGWQNDLNLEWLPTTGTSNTAGGTFEQFGVNYDLQYSGALIPGWMVSWTNQFRYRAWDGPGGGAGLPGSAFRFGWDIAFETAAAGPISWRFGINPSINTDLDGSISSDAWQLDGRAILMMQLNQYWNLMLGAGYWDRVSGRVIPYAGLIYRDDFWEWQLTFPEAQIKLFLGNEAMWSKWMYFRAEYHVEAYEVGLAGGGSDEVELEDIRLMLGFRMDTGTYSWFTEGGWVIDREVNYGLSANADWEANTAFMARFGWRY